MTLLTIGDAVVKSADYLARKGIDGARLDAELLLAHLVSSGDRLRLYLDWQKPLNDLEVAAYRDLIRRRGQEREPVARIVGKKAFLDFVFDVTPDTFVPRPETEGVVQRALILLAGEPGLVQGQPTVFEVGTGTGCISVSLAAKRTGPRYIATDVLPGALATARANAARYKVDDRIEFRLGPCFAGYEGSIGLLVSNPPYVESGIIPTLAPEVARHDPPGALDGGEDGLRVVRELAVEGARRLLPGAWVVMELGEGQPARAAEFFRETGHYDDFRCERDLAGLDRYFMARRKASG